MHVRLLYNYASSPDGKRLALKRGYHLKDKLVEGWDGLIDDNMTRQQALDYILFFINDNHDTTNLLIPLAIERGDVVYFTKQRVAYARTKTRWKLIHGFKNPPLFAKEKSTW
jgi:hypothetical protein